MPPLRITDANGNDYGPLMPGDALFKNCENKFEIGRLIQAGQTLSAAVKFWGKPRVSDAKWEHAAIASSDNGTLVEAVSGGVTVNEMATEADYIVFRCDNNAVTNVAVSFARMLLEHKLEAGDSGENRFGYSIKGALKAWANPSKTSPTTDTAEARIDALFPPSSRPAQAQDMFCSQFLALCYIIGAEQNGLNPGDYIERKDHVLTPNEMVSLLRENDHWTFVGISARGNH